MDPVLAQLKDRILRLLSYGLNYLWFQISLNELEDLAYILGYRSEDDQWIEFDNGHVPPKLHNLLGHASDQIKQINNLDDFSEEYIDRMVHSR